MSFSFQPGSAGSEVGVGGSSSSSSSSPEASGAVEVVRLPLSGPWDYALLSGIGSSVKRVPSLLPDNEDELPPLLITTGEDEAGGVCLFMLRAFAERGSRVSFTSCAQRNQLIIQ